MNTSKVVLLVLESFQAGKESNYEEIKALERHNESLHLKLKAATDRIDSATADHREDLTKIESARYRNIRKTGEPDYQPIIPHLIDILQAATINAAGGDHAGLVCLEKDDAKEILNILRELSALKFGK